MIFGGGGGCEVLLAEGGSVGSGMGNRSAEVEVATLI